MVLVFFLNVCSWMCKSIKFIKNRKKTCSCAHGARAFSYKATLLSNGLPVSVRVAATLSMFKTRLKALLFAKA